MIFEALTLTDFGVYAGTHRLELAPIEDRPITVIGGVNGAGKTTLLEALLLCLHGRRALWPAISKREYDEHVASRIHAPPQSNPEPPREAKVLLTFTHGEAGAVVSYEVERAWRLTAKGAVKERLRLFRDEEEQEDLTGTQSQTFLDSVLPPALASLFLFDGEKIQDLADDDSGRELRDAVRRLLGLDLLERLRSDLGRYANRAGGAGRATSDPRLAQARNALDAATVELDRAAVKQVELTKDRERLAKRSGRCRERFEAEGGALAEARGKLERRAERTAQRTRRANEALRELTQGPLPLCLCPAIAEALAARLTSEQKAEEDDIVRERLAARRRELEKALTARSGEPAVTVLGQLLAGTESSTPRIHEVSVAQRVRMLEQLERIRDEVPARARKAAKQLRAARTEHANVVAALEEAPDADVIAPLVAELQRLDRAIGAIEQAELEIAKECQVLKHRHRVAERELSQALEARALAEQASSRTRLAFQTIAALNEFERETAQAKMRAVQLATARYFNRLSRKGELLSAVEIDLETFSMTLRRWDRRPLPKARLSAGERQLLAIAVLWALATVSGRPLPVVIDTPLARLDAAHREKLVREYLPSVSHQVIVLSTDTEITATDAEGLRASVARSYRLQHDPEELASRVMPGYFSEAVADAG